MSEKYSIGEFSKKTVTTIRTLHYYDEIGILKPSFVSENGRRYYSNKDLATLQRIVTLKFLGFSLEQIKDLFQTEAWELKDSLLFQKKVMNEKKEQIETVIRALDHALHILQDDEKIDPSVFITLIHNLQMENEHKEWFKSLLDEGKVEKMYDIPEDQQLTIEKQWVEISTELKKLYGSNPEDTRVQQLIEQYMILVDEITGDDLAFVEEIANVEIEDDEWLFHSPFSTEEEKWISRALEIYLEKNGVKFNAGNRTEESS